MGGVVPTSALPGPPPREPRGEVVGSDGVSRAFAGVGVPHARALSLWGRGGSLGVPRTRLAPPEG